MPSFPRRTLVRALRLSAAPRNRARRESKPPASSARLRTTRLARACVCVVAAVAAALKFVAASGGRALRFRSDWCSPRICADCQRT